MLSYSAPATSIKDHPATRAWLRASRTARVPYGVVVLKDHPTGQAYRLVAALADGRAVVAKRSRLTTIEVERRVYEDVLPLTRVPSLAFYGSVGDDDDHAWLFIEDAAGVPLDRRDSHHRALAAGWLASLHAHATDLPAIFGLPERTPAYYLAEIQESHREVLAAQSRSIFGAHQRQVLRDVEDVLASAEEQWPRLLSVCDSLPPTLVHGDFVPKNIQVTRTGGNPCVSVFDWEIGGWGPPVADLGFVDAAPYWRVAGSGSSPMTSEDAHLLTAAGSLLRWALATRWETLGLQSHWVERPLERLAVYRDRIRLAMAQLGWDR